MKTKVNINIFNQHIYSCALAERETGLVSGSLAPETVLVTLTLKNLLFASQVFRVLQDWADRQGNDYIEPCRNCSCVDAQTICFGNKEQKALNSLKLGRTFLGAERFRLNPDR